MKSFAMEVAFLIPIFLIIFMNYRQSALTEPSSLCYGDITRWLLTYFTGSGIFALLRLLRAPILRGLNHKTYFNYTISLIVLQLLFYIAMFFMGNGTFIAAWKPEIQCEAEQSDPVLAEKNRYNPIMLLAIMGVIMSFYWFIVIVLLQLIIFVLILWSLWDGVMHASERLQKGFTVSNLVELLMRAMGEGELQDSVVIGGIQYLMNDESYFCKRCTKPFTELQAQANEFEDQFSESVMSRHDREADENIVQLGCNPAHVFHAKCIESFDFCPECLVPIEKESEATGMHLEVSQQ